LLNFVALRPSDDFYPPISLRMGEQGITVIRICVSAAASLQGVPTVTSSSGHKRLDAAAVTWASEALRFEPATRNGTAVPGCKGVRVNFRLR
jgi:protein TonB